MSILWWTHATIMSHILSGVTLSYVNAGTGLWACLLPSQPGLWSYSEPQWTGVGGLAQGSGVKIEAWHEYPLSPSRWPSNSTVIIEWIYNTHILRVLKEAKLYWPCAKLLLRVESWYIPRVMLRRGPLGFNISDQVCCCITYDLDSAENERCCSVLCGILLLGDGSQCTCTLVVWKDFLPSTEGAAIGCNESTHIPVTSGNPEHQH